MTGRTIVSGLGKPGSNRILPPGSARLAAGAAAYGVASYVFLVLSARAMGRDTFSSLASFWSAITILGVGVLQPVEQEIARSVSHRVARNEGRGHLLRVAWTAGLSIALVLSAGILALSSVLSRELFGGRTLMVIVLALTIPALAGMYMTWGNLSGNGEFTTFGLGLLLISVILLVATCVTFATGARSPVAFASILPCVFLAGTAMGQIKRQDLGGKGPRVVATELTGAIGTLVVGSLLSQVLAYAGPILIGILSPDRRSPAAGRYLAGLSMARVPITLYAGAQAALIPELSRHVAEGNREAFVARLRALAAVIGCVAAVGLAVVLSIGPWSVRFVFGSGFALSRADLLSLTGGSCAFLLALAFAQALLALAHRRDAVYAWAIGVLAMGAVAALPLTPLSKAELGYLIGCSVAAAAMLALLGRRTYGSAAGFSSLVGITAN